ncbi:hypothetical protein EZJ49_02285 [Bdellovibrio bacteriovorus]|uniref:hypothetical protein n=1 Tax=Bdellovibrio bacteriovorus TaxID=959 RepID=UPI0021CFF228|nr:hypothetical protein [Bdellovibrio bacteriovorus]UXR65075.1 hypothetical protein EZJ49_02285 [Bdellovibrio bacteriovorus]
MSNNVSAYIEVKLLEAAKDKWVFQNFKFEGHKLRPLERKMYFDFGVIEVFLNPNGSIDVVGDFYRNSIKASEYASAQDACVLIYDHLRYADQNYHRLIEAPENWTKPGFISKLFAGFRKAG